MALIQIQSIKQANEIVGGLSSPSKMPGYCISLPAEKCKTGSKLRKVKGSVCSKCYACGGNYRYPVVIEALDRRFKQLKDPNWVRALVYLILKRASRHPEFRWHDSGDIQNKTHFNKMRQVAKQTPMVKHWVPTKEVALIREFIKSGGTIPANMCVRVSMPKVGQAPKDVCGLPTSTVDSGVGFQCPVKNSEEGCDTYNCRACWDPTIANIDYRIH